MNIAFAGFRHGHIFGLYNAAKDNKNVNVIGCFEEDPEERKSIEEKQGICFNYQSYEDLVNDEKVEAVAIGDYYGKRGKLAIEALKHGKHIICDKPICTDLKELDEIEKLAEEKNLQVCCMLDLRYMPQVARVKEMIQKGEIGAVHIASFTGQHCLYYGSRPGWYFEKGKHGGTINDIAIHGVDLVRFITGKNLTGINFAKTWNAFADKEPDFKDCGMFNAEMEGMTVSADVSYAAPAFDGVMPTYWDFYFWGTKGMINFNFRDSKLKIFKEQEEIIECGEMKINYLEDFIDEISGKKTIMNTTDIIESQRQVLEIQKRADESNM